MQLKIKYILIAFACMYACNSQNKTGSIQSLDHFQQLVKISENEAQNLKSRLEAAIEADSIAEEAKNDTNCIIAGKITAKLYMKLGDDSMAKIYFLKSSKSAEKLLDFEEVGISLNYIGLLHNDRSEFDSALLYYKRSNEIFASYKFALRAAQSMENMAIVFKAQGNLEEAFRLSLGAAKQLELLKAPDDLASAYNTVANVLKDLKRYDEALNYHELALKLRTSEKDSIGMAGSLNNIGNIYRYKTDYTHAVEYYSRALEIKERVGTPKSIATTVDNLGETYFAQKEYEKAEQYYIRALAIRSKSSDIDGYSETSNRLAKLYLTINDFQRSEDMAEQAAKVLLGSSYLKQLLENRILLSEIYQKLHKYELAIRYADSALQLKDSLFNSDMARAISQMQTKYKTEEKEKELQSAKQQAAIESERNEAKFQFWGIAALAIVLTSFIGFYFYRKRQKYLFRQEILEVKQEALIAQLDTHFISDTIDSINGFVEENEKDAASEYLLRFSRLIRSVLGNSFKKMVSLQDDLADLDDYFKLAKLRFPDDQVTISVDIDGSIDPEFTLIPPMILQVLSENAMQHAFTSAKKGILTITVRKMGALIQCTVSDNGVGRKASEANKKTERNSYGSGLAEKLMKVWGESEGKTTFEIKDLIDDQGNPIGTRADFSFPYITHN